MTPCTSNEGKKWSAILCIFWPTNLTASLCEVPFLSDRITYIFIMMSQFAQAVNR